MLLPIAHRNHFFCLYKQNKSSNSKGKYKQASNHGKRILEAGKLAYANKIKESICSQKLGFWTFGYLLIALSTKVNVLYPLYSTAWRCCLLHLIKQNYLLKTFLRTLILMTLVSLYLFSFQYQDSFQWFQSFLCMIFYCITFNIPFSLKVKLYSFFVLSLPCFFIYLYWVCNDIFLYFLLMTTK